MKVNKIGIIYKVVNQENNMIYIGATTKSIEQRKLDHLERANRGEDGKFQQAIVTYGADVFKWEQIDTASCINELAQKEKQYIFDYRAKETGYNSDEGGGFKKTVFQFDIETGNIVNSYVDLESAGNAVNASKKSISNACLGYSKFCKGFLWSYSDTLEINLILDLRKKAVNQISLDGEVIACYESVSDASQKSGISKTCISRCCRRERKQSGGFIWNYS